MKISKTLSLLLAGIMVFSLPFAQPIYASPINLVAPDVFTSSLGTNFMVSTRTDINTVPNAFSGNGTYWNAGNSSVYPSAGNYGCLWLAVDLGAVRGLSGAQFVVNAGSISNARNRAQSYAVYYSEDIGAWNSLTPKDSPRNTLSTYNPSAWEYWTLADQASTTQLVSTSYGGNNNTALGSFSFEEARARYVLLCFVLTPGASGMFDIGDVRFMGSNTPPLEKPDYPIERPALTNLSASVSGTRVKTSSESAANPAVNAFSSGSSSWNMGANSVYPASGRNGGLWVAADLGSIYDVYDVELTFPVTVTEIRQRVSRYEVFYSVIPQSWQSLSPASPTNVSGDYYPSGGWTSFGARQTGSLTTNIDTFTVLKPAQARYILIYIELMPGASGNMGLSQVRVMGTSQNFNPVASAVYPQYGAFSKDAPNSVSTSIIYNGNNLTQLSVNGTAVAASNYSISGDSNSGTLTFNQSYLNNLPIGTYSFSFRFSSGASQPYTLVVASFGAGSGNLTAPPIDPSRVWASSANSARPAVYAFNDDNFWSLGANTVYPSTGTSGIYVAVDLGTEKLIDSFSFVLPASAANAQARLQSLELYGATNAQAWNQIISRSPNNSALFDKPDANLWRLGGSIQASSITNTVRYSYLGTDGTITTSTWPTASVNLSGQLRARYVMAYLNLKPGSPGTMGVGNLQIFGSDPSAGTVAAISPSFGQFDKTLQNMVSTAVSLNGDNFVSATYNGQTLRRNADYTMSDGSISTVRFTSDFLNTLRDGKHNINFNFTNSPAQVFTITVINPLFSDAYLNQPGSGFAVLTPRYSGMSLTIGRPALINASQTTGKFPRFDITNAKNGTFISGMLIGPGGNVVYNVPRQPVNSGGAISIPDTVPLTQGLYKLALTLDNNSANLYDTFYFTAITDFARYRSVGNTQNSNNSNVANINPDSPGTAEYPAMRIDNNGNLVLAPDYKGNQIIDFSSVGYKSGAEPIPNVPIRRVVSPKNNANDDAWEDIQSAINYVSGLPLDSSGFRGTVYLEQGVYRISRPLTITTSGVVLRGAGPGTVPNNVTGDGSEWSPYDQKIASYAYEAGVTKLIATWRLTEGAYTPPNDHTSIADSPYRKEFDSTMITVSGGDLGNYRTGSATTNITDQYVGAGQYQLRVASTTGFQAGDSIHILRMVNADWARSMYMNYVDGASNWVPDGENLVLNLNPQTDAIPPFYMEREIAAIDRVNNIITLAQPLSDNLDRRWGVSQVVKISTDNRIRNVGIENIQGIAEFSNTTSKPTLERYGTWISTYNDENHAQVFVEMANVKDGWMRNFTTFHLDTAFVTNHGTRNITVQDGNILDPVSVANGGERRYGMYIRKGQMILGQRLYARFTRHAYTLDSTVSGPNVFRDARSEYLTNASEPHFRWSSGGLFDNVSSRIYIQNRWDMGTSHGHAGVNYVMYNCEGPYMISQPQLAPNYQIGHSFSVNNRLGTATNTSTGQQAFDKRVSPNLSSLGLNGGMVPNYPAYQYITNRKVTAADNMPTSLYLQQLGDAYGDNAVQNALVSQMPPNIDGGDIGRNYGDINGDGVINAADLTMLRRYLAATDKDAFVSNNSFNLINADVNGDGVINNDDLNLLRRYLAATNPGSVRLGP